MENVVLVKDVAVLTKTAKGYDVVTMQGEQLKFDNEWNLVVSEEVALKDKLRYFFFMGREQVEIVRKWIDTIEPQSEAQSIFIDIVKTALEMISYNYMISTIEPSILENGKLYFFKGCKAAVLSYHMFCEKAKEFASEYDSDIATLYELFLWYAYRCAMKYWSIEYICDDSSEAGNYSNSPDAYQNLESTGKRFVGGFCDGIGNLPKLIRYGSTCASCGGFYYNHGKFNAVAKLRKINDDPKGFLDQGSCAVVLRNV